MSCYMMQLLFRPWPLTYTIYVYLHQMFSVFWFYIYKALNNLALQIVGFQPNQTATWPEPNKVSGFGLGLDHFVVWNFGLGLNGKWKWNLLISNATIISLSDYAKLCMSCVTQYPVGRSIATKQSKNITPGLWLVWVSNLVVVLVGFSWVFKTWIQARFGSQF